jgi:hypothetical protein
VALSSFFFSIYTLIPIILIFFSEFIIGKKVFNEKKYDERVKNINLLHKNGNLTDEEYNKKLSELKLLKTRCQVLLSKEFLFLQKEFDKRNLTKQELDTYMNDELKKRMDKQKVNTVNS